MAQLVINNKIWDLHIHSNQCSSASQETKSLTVSKYVTKLIEIFDKYEDLEMISFTDHNKLSIDLYKEYYGRNYERVKLLPGVEVDTKFEENGSDKHVIIYFDLMEDVKELDEYSKKLNELLKDTTPKNPILASTLFSKLLDFNVPFILNPHAMKQNDRAIDFDWHILEKDERDSFKYVDQFFCFWETSGYSQIAHALDFLKSMDLDEKISIISFSDSKDFKKLESYLSNPTT